MSDPNSSVQNKILTGILIVLTFSLLFVGYFHQVTAFTQDLGRHLLLGKIILTTKSVPNTNLLSYTYPDFPFLNHHYLSEVIFFLLFQIGGSLMLLLLVTFTALISFGLEYFYLLKRSNIIPLSITAFLLIMVLFERTDIRPEIFSFLFLSIFVTILYLNRERQTKLIYLLPLLMLLWTNMHIYFLVGIVIVICFLFDGIFFILPSKKINTSAEC